MAGACGGGSSSGTGRGRGDGDGMDGRTGRGAPTDSSPTAAGEERVNDGNINDPWTHGTRVGSQGFICRYCNLLKKGGGATRLREHLGALGTDVVKCLSVPRDVQGAMRKGRIIGQENKSARRKRNLRLERELMDMLEENEVVDVDSPSDEDEQLKMALAKSRRDAHIRHAVERLGGTFEHDSRSGSGGGCAGSCSSGRIGEMLRNARTTSGRRSTSGSVASEKAPSKDSYQPRIDVTLAKGSKEKQGTAWAKWFHANDIPGRKANCPYFRAALRLSHELGPVESLPKGTDIDGVYLEGNYMEMELYVEKFKKDWDQFGVTVMCDSWTGPTFMSIINFMVYCDERMFFHKSINATGQIQNADFLFSEIKKVVVDEIGHKRVMQIVTDNGSNYKKACSKLTIEYPHIFWQPCAAHTINLMLKDIGEFPEVAGVVKSAKRICRFLYNHNRLHDEMKKMIGGELIRPNATRFGTQFIFLQSFWDRKDKFRRWMVSEQWKNCDWRRDPDYDFVEEKLTSPIWWSSLRSVLDTVEPLYTMLRYADQQKVGTISGFKPRMMASIHSMESHLGSGTEEFDKYMSKVSARVRYLEENTMIVAAAALDPEAHYKLNFSSNAAYIDVLQDVIGRMADSPDNAVLAMKEFMLFRANKGKFDGTMARLAVSTVNPTAWWLQYGGEVKELQKYALRIVSQCVSSSGCERNWSTFALVHTKVRNRLGYEKLHKLVYVHYNLKLRLQQNEIEQEEKDLDPFAIVMDATMFDEANPIHEWLNKSMSRSASLLDERGRPSQVVRDEIRREKRMLSLARKEKVKKGKMSLLDEEEEFVDSDETSSKDADNDYDDEEEDEYLERYSPERLAKEVEEERERAKEAEEGRERAKEAEEGRQDQPLCSQRPKRDKAKKKDVNSLYF